MLVPVGVAVIASCLSCTSGSPSAPNGGSSAATTPPGAAVSGDDLAAAKHVLDPRAPEQVSDDQARCAARDILANPTLAEAARHPESIADEAVAGAVATARLGCAHDLVVNAFVASAPTTFNGSELSCVRNGLLASDPKVVAEIIAMGSFTATGRLGQLLQICGYTAPAPPGSGQPPAGPVVPGDSDG